MKRNRLGLFLMWMLLPLNLCTQGHYLSKSYYPDDYKGNPQVWTITSDTNGIMYFGTTGKLHTYDGVIWRSIANSVNGIRSLFWSDTFKTMYIGTDSNVGKLTTDSIGGLAFEEILDSTLLHNTKLTGTYYINEIDSLIYFQEGAQTIVHNPITNTNRLLFKDRKNNKSFEFNKQLWIRDGLSGYGFFENDSIHYIDSKEFFFQKLVYIQKKFQNRLYFFPENNPVSYWDGTRLVRIEGAMSDTLKKYPVYRAVVIHDSLLALGSFTGGVFVYNKQHELVQRFTENNGLITNIVYELYYDRNQLWIGQDKGVTRIQYPTSIQLIGEKVGIKGLPVVMESDGSSVVVGTTNGLFEILKNNDFKLHQISGIRRVYDLLSIPNSQMNSTILAATSDGIFVKRNNEWFPFANKSVLKLEFQKNENLLWADADAWGVFNLQELSKFEVSSTQSNANLNWTSDSNFIYLGFPDGRIIKSDIQTGEQIWEYWDSNKDVTNIVNDINLVGQQVWIAQQYCLLILNKQTGKSDVPNGISKTRLNETVMTFLKQDSTTIWVRGHYDLFQLKKKNEVWSERSIPYQQIAYEQAVRDMTLTGSELWTATPNGIWYADLTHLAEPIPFKTIITEIRLKNDSLNRLGFSNYPSRNSFAYSNNQLRFKFAAPVFWNEDRTQFRFKLIGNEDESWSNWSHETQKDYTNLREGKYTFVVESKDLFDQIGESATFSFRILPPWYRTWWAYLGYLTVLFLTVYAAYSWRIAQLTKEFAMRNKIEHDLHDEVSATLSSISFFAQALQLNRSENEKQRFVQLIRDSAGDAKEKITDIVWAVNPEHDNWDSFLAKVKRYLSDMFESAELAYDVRMPDTFSGVLNMKMRHELWLIIKEITTNVCRHAEAKQVSIRIQFHSNQFELIVQVDGKGISQEVLYSEHQSGNGLNSIRKRVLELKGLVNLETELNMGTRWKISIPL